MVPVSIEKTGKIKCLGVSNFNEAHLTELLSDPTITYPPRINQVEVHPFYQQRSLRTFCQTHHIVIEAYSSLGQNNPKLREHPVVLKISEKYNMTPAQVLLR